MSDFNRYITANEVIRRATGSSGLPKPQNIMDATDATTRQMVDILNECGQDLLAEYNWQSMIRTFELTTAEDKEYSYPADLERFIDDTGWNNTGRIPLLGPINPQQWRMLQARQLGGTTLRLQYTIRNDKFILYFSPSPAQNLAIDYVSRGWVQDASDPEVRRDFVQNSADIIMYPARLIISMLKWKWREAKGFDTTAAEREYRMVLNAARYDDKPHTALPLTGRSQFPYLGYVNIPDTHLGS